MSRETVTAAALARVGLERRRQFSRDGEATERVIVPPPRQSWRADVWRLVGGTDVEILNWLDDHFRFFSDRLPSGEPTGRASVA